MMIKFENKNNGRYFYLYIARDMFDDLVLTVIRGGRNARVLRNYRSGDLPVLEGEIARISKQRIKRGYTLVN